MKRFHIRYLAVAVALCVMLTGAAIAAASSGDNNNGTDAAAQAQNNSGNGPQGNPPAHARNNKLSVRSLLGNPGNGPSTRVLETPAAYRAAPQSAVASLAASVGLRVLPPDDSRYQWTGEIRRLDDRFVLYRDCDRWLLDPQSREAHEALRAYAESGRVDVWGTLSRDARHTIAVESVYGAGDPRPRILMQDYPCPRQHDAAPKIDWVSGWVGEIDIDNRVIVLRLPENGPMRFHVTDDTSIAIDGEPARFGSLETGMVARVAFEPRTQNALRIMAASERHDPEPELKTVGGMINVVNDAGLSLHLRDGSDVRFYFTDDTRVVLDGERVRPSALEAGMTARVTYNIQSREALRIQAASERPDSDPSAEIEWAGGWIEEVDLDNRVVVLRLEDSHMRFQVTANTGIAIDLQRATLDDLEPGMAARIAYDPDSHNALRIMAISNQ